MNYSEKLNKLADKVELKLKKYAQEGEEVDSTMVTLAVRPAINNIIVNQGIQKSLENLFNKVAKIEADKGTVLSGWMQIGENFFLTANKINNVWTIDKSKTYIKTDGDLRDHQLVKPTFDSIVMNFYKTALPYIEKELNRVIKEGSKITNIEIGVNKCEVSS